ncbi:Saccharopine dehydrogenase [Xylographa parallela]|nr:Saccharopine dehydrogenase [Xylographa parallela]
MAATVLHLRSECKPMEHRSALTPQTTKQLLEAGYTVNVERSPERIFEDSEFEAVGATLVPEGSWPSAPADHLIIGLKELPEEDFPLNHTHIQFAHCYKGQSNWEEVLSRFPSGSGTLYDLEFLNDENGRRVAAFGYHAGYAGAAIAVMVWAWQLDPATKGKPFPSIDYYRSEADLVTKVKRSLEEGMKYTSSLPRVMVMGALGRCGSGALGLCKAIGIPDSSMVKWDLAETSQRPGPYEEIVESDIFVNCIYLSKPIPPFLNRETLSSSKRKLSVVCDVSCDTTNPHNPIPIYNICTTFEKPTVPVKVDRDPPLSVISIDHLPSLLPREASQDFSDALLPSLLKLHNRKQERVWQQAEDLFREKVAGLSAKWRQGQAFLGGAAVPTGRP